ncbi:hypothetical protein [Phaeobacter gallaeciensis]|uniref:hypothetical protein n=1 Tax=Phaeobacter gallaeciensis TaxID=60890 RepID=UPI00237EF1BC|nr:hypothetical protein [Phaeobacter gallaeciensis]MDE4189649.1 hypothetical protein [Phaeobacter gallaeciensis]MDE4198801.1 hypothetical protein [Phaeobacter gallaeciensis]MDE4202947.1 hypothetical protein [Phaeobacter gallaeciensis]MDE4207090.1 hypothetical protein [Phaeobacter gallaeciensis]MDE4215685.1 hypothetical protein [Phaeobacter gallaeciensis]
MSIKVSMAHDVSTTQMHYQLEVGKELSDKFMVEIKARERAERQGEQLRKGEEALRRRELRCRMKRKVK